MSFKYVDCMATPRLIEGIFADCEKKSTVGAFCRLNLNPTGDKKFLFRICLSQAVKFPDPVVAMVTFYYYLEP
jgi:hypothetical protein